MKQYYESILSIIPFDKVCYVLTIDNKLGIRMIDGSTLNMDSISEEEAQKFLTQYKKYLQGGK